MQALINKINKSIVAPLPTMYSGAFRGLVKSMLRKNPELRPSAAELLRHPHLQPYVLKIHLKSNSPRRSTLPVHNPQSNYMKKTRFQEPEGFPLLADTEKRRSFSNDRTLNPSISGAEQDSLCSTKRIQEFSSYINQKFAELSVSNTHEEIGVNKPIAAKTSSISKTPRLTPAKASATPRRQTEPSKMAHIGSNRESLPASHTPASKSVPPTRRISLPLPTRAATVESPCRPKFSLLRPMSSPDVSVNAPRIDRIAEFPLASSEDPLFPFRRTSSISQGSSTSPYCGDLSITKDKCTVQIHDTAFTRSNFTDAWHGIQNCMFQLDGEDGSESSDKNPTSGRSSRSSSDLRQRRFDTSSYQQRAEALEGLLEFSAQLLQQERFEELGVLLKPFGLEKVSPRETAIWLTKSFKETTVKQED